MDERKRVPRGFRFGGVACGIKPSGLPDLALVVADTAVVAAGVYTQNLVHAASIDWNRAITPTATLRAIVINSGNANACTGARGVADNAEMASQVASGLSALSTQNVAREQVLVLSTGVIGQHLPMERVRRGIEQCLGHLEASGDGFAAAAKAILTTDHGPKTTALEHESGFAITAMCKGAGMIGPNMATMLGIITTDFALTPQTADAVLRQAVNRSFNRISVEGHTSTNDAVLLLAPLAKSPPPAPQVAVFQTELNRLCIDLAKRIPTDGEGAQHLIHIQVQGAGDDAGADRMARAIALSNLVKTAVAGGDPNWGRIVSAAGYCGANFSVSETSLQLNGIEVFREGQPTDFDRKRASQSIKQNRLTEILLTVGSGPGSSEHWTSDLTVEYVKLNAEYTT
ncbi:MAG: bifunctional glutamate N-acetyltransferase/amino-acid acetyltransferase ArgJ [Planctomycetota bacterium]